MDSRQNVDFLQEKAIKLLDLLNSDDIDKALKKLFKRIEKKTKIIF